MELKQISKWVMITGALFIWAVKLFIRPQFHFDEPLHFFFGIAPNLVGSFLIPFGACWFFSGREFLLARIFRVENLNDLRIVCLLGFGMLVINEYLQLLPVFGRTFDYNDIVFSSVGLVISYFVFSKAQEKYQPA
ncbi:MAG TPA: hypothetical protein PKG90_13975 [Chitinophagaceae bacterium]|nr:hypothetical protein [Chitinophagaceae bacterium]HNU15835.1 hypothetical protein [Chitinophagaceae bacterium]